MKKNDTGKSDVLKGFKASDKVSLLQANFEQYYRMAMDHYTKAGTTSQILLGIAGAVIVVVGYDKSITSDSVDKASAWLIMLIGLFGAVWAGRQMQRYRYWQAIALAYHKEIQGIWPDFKTKDEYSSVAFDESVTTFPGILGCFFARVKDRYLWVILHVFIFIIGFVLLIMAGSAKDDAADSVPNRSAETPAIIVLAPQKDTTEDKGD